MFKSKPFLSLRELLLSALFSALMVVSARIAFPIPFYPVMFSMQTFVVLMTGLLLRPRASFACMALYLMMGLLGLPVFTQGGGLMYILQPSFGYILGFVVAAPLIGTLYGKSSSKWAAALSCLTGAALIHVCGVAYFATISAFYLGTPISLAKALYMLTIYLPIDVVKLVVALMIAEPVRRRVSQAQA